MKYIVISLIDATIDLEMELPVIFPKMLVHSQVYETNALMLKLTHPNAIVSAVSAGEINFAGQNLSCCGKSTTLNLSSRGEIDNTLIQMHDYTSGLQ